MKFLVAAILGALVGLFSGYVTHRIGPAGIEPLHLWATDSFYLPTVLMWVLGGAIIAFALVFLISERKA